MRNETSVPFEPARYWEVIVGAVIAQNHMQPACARKLRIQKLQKLQKLLMAMARITLPHGLALRDFQGGERRRRAAAFASRVIVPQCAFLSGHPSCVRSKA